MSGTPHLVSRTAHFRLMCPSAPPLLTKAGLRQLGASWGIARGPAYETWLSNPWNIWRALRNKNRPGKLSPVAAGLAPHNQPLHAGAGHRVSLPESTSLRHTQGSQAQVGLRCFSTRLRGAVVARVSCANYARRKAPERPSSLQLRVEPPSFPYQVVAAPVVPICP